MRFLQGFGRTKRRPGPSSPFPTAPTTTSIFPRPRHQDAESPLKRRPMVHVLNDGSPGGRLAQYAKDGHPRFLMWTAEPHMEGPQNSLGLQVVRVPESCFTILMYFTKKEGPGPSAH